jgi:DHA3 family macrolide efflux protein-like MFS transporter
MNPLVNGPLFAVVQAVVAPEMQGRVFTLITSFAMAMAPIGLIVAGPIADRLGVQTWYVIGGVMTMLLGLGAFLIPAIMNIENRPAQAEQSTDDPATPVQAFTPGLADVTGD